MREYAGKSVMATLASMRQCFRRPRYALFAFVLSSSVLLFAIWLPNLRFVGSTIISPDLSFGKKVTLLAFSLAALETNFTPLSRTLTILTALLFGINASFLVFYIARRMKAQKAAGASLGGIASGLVGIGCASCGSVILSSAFGVGATAGFLGVLPLGGQEFGVLSVSILSFSIYITAKKMQDSSSCKIH